MFKDKLRRKLELKAATDAAENAGEDIAEKAPERGADNASENAPLNAGENAAEKTRQDSAALTSNRNNSKHQSNVEPPHRERPPLPWWRANLQPLVIAGLAILAIPITLLHLELSGDEWLDRSQPEKAKNAYLKEYTANPKNVHAADQLARIAILEDRPHDAVRLFDQELLLKPSNKETAAAALALRGFSSLELKQYDNALSDLENASPQDYWTKLGRIKALVGLGRLQEASALAEQASKLSPQSGWRNRDPAYAEVKAKERTFAIFMLAQDYKKALQFCAEQIKDDEKVRFEYGNWILRKADVLYAMGDSKQALAIYNAAPDRTLPSTSLENKAGILRSYGKLDEAIKCYTRAMDDVGMFYPKGLDTKIRCQTAIAEIEAARGNQAAVQKAKTALTVLNGQHDMPTHTFTAGDLKYPNPSIQARLFGELD